MKTVLKSCSYQIREHKTATFWSTGALNYTAGLWSPKFRDAALRKIERGMNSFFLGNLRSQHEKYKFFRELTL